MDKSLIISRYKEDISWIKPHKDFNLFIYNKGPKLKNIDHVQYRSLINLENVGRESHTWLYHIVNNYHVLDDISIFLQGRIDDLNCMAFQDPNDYIKKINKYGFAVSRYGLLSPFHWKFNVGIEKNEKYKKNWDNFEISRSKIGFRKFAESLFPDIPRFVATSYGGCFAIKNNLIKKYSLEFYSKLLYTLSLHKNPIEGHYMERLWCYMFTNNAPLVESIFDVIHTKLERLNLQNGLKTLNLLNLRN